MIVAKSHISARGSFAIPCLGFSEKYLQSLREGFDIDPGGDPSMGGQGLGFVCFTIC